VWYFRTVPTVWYFRSVPTVLVFLFFIFFVITGVSWGFDICQYTRTIDEF
jgi:hypothetical protein